MQGLAGKEADGQSRIAADLDQNDPGGVSFVFVPVGQSAVCNPVSHQDAATQAQRGAFAGCAVAIGNFKDKHTNSCPQPDGHDVSVWGTDKNEAGKYCQQQDGCDEPHPDERGLTARVFSDEFDETQA